MKKTKTLLALLLTGLLVGNPSGRVDASIPIAKIIQEGIKKVIRAVDLMVQRLQNKTIWLQNAQKILENKLNELKLTEIAEWTEKHRQMYQDYYEELWKVKNTIAMYQRVRQVMEKQIEIVTEYKRGWRIVQKDKHFTKAELEHMYKVYGGILEESVANLDQVILVINSFNVQMSDGARLEIIDHAADAINQNFSDLKQFNTQNMLLSVNRAKNANEIEMVKKLYEIPTE